MTEERIVIVGASLAGLRGAEALREAGFQGELTLVGNEVDAPYDRPPLSKHLLTREIPASLTALPNLYQLHAEWRLGVAATGLDIKNRTVELANGDRLPFDQLLITTGTRPRPWSNPTEAALDGVFLLRSQGDAVRLRAKLAAMPGRVVIIGGGFIGCEVASCCCDLGLPVTVIERKALLVHALGKAIGDIVAQMQRSAGVDLRLGVSVSKIEANSEGHVQRVHLSDGTVIDTDLVVIAIGAVRNIEWLQESGLAVSQGGVRCDQFCRVLDPLQEVLRFEPPVQFRTRTTLADIEIAGTVIPKGVPLVLLLASGNRDPLQFNDPERFDPDRQNNQHFGFGGSLHLCLGAPLARMEGELAFRALVQRLQSPRLVEDVPEYRQGASLRGPKHLLVKVDAVTDA